MLLPKTTEPLIPALFQAMDALSDYACNGPAQSLIWCCYQNLFIMRILFLGLFLTASLPALAQFYIGAGAQVQLTGNTQVTLSDADLKKCLEKLEALITNK